MISARVTVMGSLTLWKEPQSPSPDPSKGWMCNLISWTGSPRASSEVFNIARAIPSEASAEVASEVVTGCDSLAGWLNTTRVPRGLRKAEGELGAAAGVYRNAAIVYLHLENVDGDRRSARSNACTRLLEQGDYHVETFVVALAKRLGDDLGFERRSTGDSRTSGGAFP